MSCYGHLLHVHLWRFVLRCEPVEGRIGYNEFIAALMERRVKIDMQQLRECFSRLDREGKVRAKGTGSS